jgi:dGTPase
LPDHFQEVIDKRGKERTIADYIAGMTDRFAIEEHGKLFDPNMLP